MKQKAVDFIVHIIILGVVFLSTGNSAVADDNVWLTEDQAYDAVYAYLEDSGTDFDTVYYYHGYLILDEPEGENYVIYYRAYTAAHARYYVNKVTGDVYVAWEKPTYDEKEPFFDREYIFNAFDYIDTETIENDIYEDEWKNAISVWYVSNDYSEGIALRESPTTKSDLLIRMPYMTMFTVTDYQDEWLYTSYGGYSGWTHGGYSTQAGLIPYEEYCRGDYELQDFGELYYTLGDETSGIPFVSAPYEEEIYCYIPGGTEFLALDYDHNWAYTCFDGYEGWIDLEYAYPEEDAEFRSDPSEYTADVGGGCPVYYPEGTSGFYKDGSLVYEDEYILPESATMYLSERDLSDLTLKGICYAKNEIYARYGRKFVSPELQNYFNGQDWYRGIYAAGSYDSQIVSMMNKYEKYNMDVLYKAEEKQGMYQLD